MHRNPFIDLLEAYQLRYPDEAETTERFYDFVVAHPTCFERSLQSGHLTASAWLVNRTGTHVLLTHHRKLNKWLQLGGHADGQTNLLHAARREAQEESGLSDLITISQQIFDIDIHRIPAHHNTPAHDHYDVRFVLQCNGDQSYTVNHESHDLRWAEIPALGDYTQEPSMLRMAAKWKALYPDRLRD